MIAQGVLFAAETATIHHLGSQTSILLLPFMRGSGGVLVALFAARALTVPAFRTRQLLLQLTRGSISLLYLWVMIYSFSHLPFADATAISYSQTIYIVLFSALILKEPVRESQWLASAVGVFGAALISRPSFASWNQAYLIAIIGTSLNGLAFVLNRYLQRDDPEPTTMFYTNVIAMLGNFPAALYAGLPTIEVVPWLSGVLIFGPIGMYAGIAATKRARASTLGPYTLVRLLIGAVGGIAIFRELPDALSTVGAALILISCILSYPGRGSRRIYLAWVIDHESVARRLWRPNLLGSTTASSINGQLPEE